MFFYQISFFSHILNGFLIALMVLSHQISQRSLCINVLNCHINSKIICSSNFCIQYQYCGSIVCSKLFIYLNVILTYKYIICYANILQFLQTCKLQISDSNKDSRINQPAYILHLQYYLSQRKPSKRNKQTFNIISVNGKTILKHVAFLRLQYSIVNETW